ncbi:MAG: hypothetical protein L0196_01765 [candidate division Zixibacteria bacterium]|nr:hypothetical protein [candidate division Zixibacteria bacterium]
MRLVASVIFLSFLTPLHNLLCQEKDENSNIKVQVEVSGEFDADARDRAQSYISRHLRKIGDVIVTDISPEWKLSVMVVPAKVEETKSLGYAISATALRVIDQLEVLRIAIRVKKQQLMASCNWDSLQTHCDKSIDEIFEPKETGSSVLIERFKDQWLSIGSDIERQCENIVINFDNKVLKEERKNRQIFRQWDKTKVRTKEK